MNRELQQKLFEKYPTIFKQKDLTPLQSPICFGIETEDGWYDLLDTLCFLLTEVCPEIEATQVKSKFGGLRFYVDHANDAANTLISFAENMSYKLCEICGNRGERIQGGWIWTLCPTHKEEKEKKNATVS
ncbi:MAG TPA: hypothetical protein PKN48_00195 [Bacteroidales bacterium]|nr:hypothetical protein [Bacteroidales bacterium]